MFLSVIPKKKITLYSKVSFVNIPKLELTVKKH